MFETHTLHPANRCNPDNRTREALCRHASELYRLYPIFRRLGSNREGESPFLRKFLTDTRQTTILGEVGSCAIGGSPLPTRFSLTTLIRFRRQLPSRILVRSGFQEYRL